MQLNQRHIIILPKRIYDKAESQKGQENPLGQLELLACSLSLSLEHGKEKPCFHIRLHSPLETLFCTVYSNHPGKVSKK